MNQQLARYRLLRQLGRGGMGIVYLAEDPLLHREVAIKTVDFAADEIDNFELLRSSLLRDARAAAGLSHPNIVNVYDVVENEGNVYLVLEYLDGETLATRLRTRNVLDAAETVRIVREMSSALDYTHSRGIIHRDIKPSNVMIDAQGAVKIMDFGVARIDGGRTNTPTGLVVGTIEYMSPEQVMGASLDGRSDQFSLAAVAYQMLTGSTLFGQQTVATLTYKIVHETPPPARTRNASLPMEVDVALSKALSKSPVERFGTCSQFASALESAFFTTPSVSVPAVESATSGRPRLERIPMLVTRNHVVTIAIVVFLLAVGLFLLRLRQPALKPPLPTHSQTAARNKGEREVTKTVETLQAKSPLPTSRTQSGQNSTASKPQQSASPTVQAESEKGEQPSPQPRPVPPTRTVGPEDTAKQVHTTVASQSVPTPAATSPTSQASQVVPEQNAVLATPRPLTANPPLNSNQPRILPAPQSGTNENTVGQSNAGQNASEASDAVLQAYRQGLSLMKVGNNSAAIDAFTEAISRSRGKFLFRHRAGYEPAYVARGFAHQDLGHPADAIQDYTEAIQLRPRDVVPYVQRGICFALLRQDDRALADFSAALSIQAAMPIALDDRGIIFGRKKQYQQAIQDFTEAIRLDPKFVSAYANRAVAERALGNDEEARNDTARARELASTK